MSNEEMKYYNLTVRDANAIPFSTKVPEHRAMHQRAVYGSPDGVKIHGACYRAGFGGATCKCIKH